MTASGRRYLRYYKGIVVNGRDTAYRDGLLFHAAECRQHRFFGRVVLRLIAQSRAGKGITDIGSESGYNEMQVLTVV